MCSSAAERSCFQAMTCRVSFTMSFTISRRKVTNETPDLLEHDAGEDAAVLEAAARQLLHLGVLLDVDLGGASGLRCHRHRAHRVQRQLLFRPCMPPPSRQRKQMIPYSAHGRLHIQDPSAVHCYRQAYRVLVMHGLPSRCSWTVGKDGHPEHPQSRKLACPNRRATCLRMADSTSSVRRKLAWL